MAQGYPQLPGPHCALLFLPHVLPHHPDALLLPISPQAPTFLFLWVCPHC